MKSFGTVVTVILGLFTLYALVMFGVSFTGLSGETPMVFSSVVALLVWAAVLLLMMQGLRLALAVLKEDRRRLGSSLTWTNALLWVVMGASVGTALFLAPGAFASCGPVFLAGFYHWGGLLGGTAGLGCWFALPYLARGYLGADASGVAPHPVRSLVIIGAVAYGIVGAFWLGAWLVLRGSIDSGTYPTSASSPYRLPYPDGERAWVIQGNNSNLNHKDEEAFAWDFRRRCGTPVLAARGGTVTRVVDSNEGNGSKKPNNRIEVTHDDKTVARYLHIARDSAKVKEGDTVQQGDPLAEVGNVGNSLTGHIHFDVEKGNTSIPITFRDVDEDKGIPRTFERYASAD
jgi:hypothetical protein